MHAVCRLCRFSDCMQHMHCNACNVCYVITEDMVPQNTMVTVWLYMELEDGDYPAKRRGLRRALKQALGCKRIFITSAMKSNSVKMQLQMSIEAMLLMYAYAFHMPGFLAGLWIKRFNALGRLVSVVVSQPADVGEDTAQSLEVPISS